VKLLVLAIHWPVASGRYVAEALRRLGHDVRTAGPVPDPPNAIWGGQVDPRYVWVPAEPEEGWQPDAVLIMDSHLGVERNGDMPWLVYGVDNHVRDYRQFEVDHLFLAHGHGARIGEPNVTWLPCGYDPTFCLPGPAWGKRHYDAAMLAVMYGRRAELLYALREGISWARLAYGTGAIYDQYAAVYQDSKLSLVVSAAGDVAQRVWETAAMGCLVVMDECQDCAALGLIDGTNCLMYHTTEEAVRQVRWALEHEKEAERIARAGQRWAQSGTWDARAEVIIQWLQKQQKADVEQYERWPEERSQSHEQAGN